METLHRLNRRTYIYRGTLGMLYVARQVAESKPALALFASTDSKRTSWQSAPASGSYVDGLASITTNSRIPLRTRVPEPCIDRDIVGSARDMFVPQRNTDRKTTQIDIDRRLGADTIEVIWI